MKKMMGIVVSGILIAISQIAIAKPVDKDKVEKAAKAFIVERYPASNSDTTLTITQKGKSKFKISKVEPLIMSDKIVGYIVEMEPTGFILLSSDDQAPPVKIYSEMGSFSSLPAGLTRVLELELLEDNEAIQCGKQDNKQKQKKYFELWTSLLSDDGNSEYSTSTANSAILTTAWHQNDPYNLYCPSASGGPDDRAWAGCTATALAQVLRHHSYPVSVTMNHSYTDNDGSCQGTHQMSDVGLTAYAWSNMPSSISTSSSLIQQQAIAKLIYHCAIALESNFEADITLAYPSYVDDVLRTYFDYTCDNYVSKSNFSNTVWYTKIKIDIDDNRPVFYAMWEVVGDELYNGHAVVCDGYRNGNEMHLDLGWSGSGTAWYNLDSVSAGGYTWTSHGAVFNILPNNLNQPPTLTNYGFNPTPPIYPHTEIEFYVYYNDPEQYLPQNINVVIDEVAYSMNQNSSGKYTKTKTISELGEHSYYFYAQDNEGLSVQTEPQYFNVTTYNTGSFVVLDYKIDDSLDISTRNNNDGVIQSGEIVSIRPRIKYANSASGTASHIDVSLISEVSYIEEGSSPENYPDMDPGDVEYPDTGEYFKVSVNNACSGLFYLDMDVEWEGEDNIDQNEHIDNAIMLDIQPEAWINISPDEYNFGAVKPRPEDDVILTLNVQNTGSKVLMVSDIQTSHADTEVIPPEDYPLPINPGKSVDVTVTIHVSGLDGTITRDIVVIYDGRAGKDEDEHLVITGLVSNTVPIYEVPTITRGQDPDIGGSKIVWEEDRDGDSKKEIWLYNVETGQERLVSPSLHYQADPFISGDLVVFIDSRYWDGTGGWTDQAAIVGYDLSIEQEFVISSNPTDQDLEGISGNLIAVRYPYQSLEDPTDFAYNLIVYEYLGNGQISQKYTTGFMPVAGTGDRSGVMSTCDFNNGILVFIIGTVHWSSGGGSYGANSLYKIDFAAGETIATSTNNPSGTSTFAAGFHNLVYVDDDPVSRDDHIYLWPGHIKMTPDIDEDYGDDYIAFNGNDIIFDRSPSSVSMNMYRRYVNNPGVEKLVTNLPSDQDEARMDGNGIVWEQKYADGTYHIYFAYLDQPDISVSSSNISFSNDMPLEGAKIDIEVKIQNTTDFNVTDDITVKLFDGDPDDDGVQLGSDFVISSGIASRSEVNHTFTSIPVGIEGEHQIYIQVIVDSFDIYANNKASKTLVVADAHTMPPTITNIWVTEYNGDGDGLVESDENIMIQWRAIPQSPLSIADTHCQIADANYVGEGSYYVILDPFAVGDYSFTIYAKDNDTSPETTIYEGNFSVAIASIAGDLNNSGNVNMGDFVKIALQWMNDTCSNGTRWCRGADLDHDTEVNIGDLNILFENWLNELFVEFYSEALETAPSWQTQGEWQFGQPTGLGGGPISGNPDPTIGYTGVNVFGVNLNGDYRTLIGGPYNLTTASIDCSGHHNVHLKFERWLNSDYAPYVTNKVQVSNNNSTWHTIWQSSSVSPMEDSNWKLVDYDISDYADNQATVYIRWSYQVTDSSAYPYSGWNIDDIQLWGSPN